MGYAIPNQITLETVTCCNCSVVFAMPDYMIKRLQERGGSFYCPNGHSQYYTKSEVQRLREKLDEQTRAATQMAERAKAAEQKMKRMGKRVSVGVCPCCNRTFQQLARHMKAKHPKFGVG